MNEFMRYLQDALARFAGGAAPEPELDADGIAHPSSAWQARDTRRRRVEIMVTGDPSRVGAAADAVDAAQQALRGRHGENLELRMTAFLDGCIHRSKWHKKIFKSAAQARQWHCEQTRTRLCDALAASRGDLVDSIVLIGHRCDDDRDEVLRQADALREQGVQVHCFHTGGDAASREIYERLAEKTAGAFMQLTDQSGIGEVMPILMAHLDSADALAALNPQTPAARKLKHMLAEESANAALPAREPDWSDAAD